MNTKHTFQKVARALLVVVTMSAGLMLASRPVFAREYIDPPKNTARFELKERAQLSPRERYEAFKLRQADQQ